MKRALLILLLVVVMAGYLGTLIARDPGYVLVTYDGYSMQTSLWVLLGLLLGISSLIYIIVRGTQVIRKSPGIYRFWRSNQKVARANQLTQKGLLLLAEGEFQRARRFLDGGIKDGLLPGLSYLAAARAAEEMGDAEARETYLRLAEESDSNLARARSILTAELAIARGDSDAALNALSQVKPNEYALKLKQKALQLDQSWRDMLKSVPELRKARPLAALALEKDAAKLGLPAQANDDGALNELYKSLSADCKQDGDVITAYARALGNSSHAEPVIRAALKRSWRTELVALYGELDESTLKTRQKTARGWLKKYPEDAELHYCLGCLHQQAGELNLARESLNHAIEFGGGHRANEKLAELLAEDGQFERSNEHLRIALSSKTTI